MKTFRHRGKDRVVGAVKIPTPEAMAAFHAKGMFHDVVAALPPAPDGIDYITAAKAALATMLGNGPDPTLPPGVDPVGDCVIAEDLHLSALRSCNAGTLWIPTTDTALATYSAATGYVRGQPATDQGTDPLAYIAWRLANPYPDGSKLLVAIAVDASNADSLRKAIWLADGVFAWASLPSEWESEEDGGDVWGVAGDPVAANGHGFAGVSFKSQAAGGNLLLSEWGLDDPPIEMTTDAAAKYWVPANGGGCVAFLGSNALNSITQKCPAGFDLSTLQGYLAGLGAPVTDGAPAAP